MRIPKEIADELHLEAKTQVAIDIVDGQIVVQSIKKPKYILQQLLAEIPDDDANNYGEIDFGPAVGKEIW